MFSEQERIQQEELLPRLNEAFQSLTAVKTVRYVDLSKISCLPGDLNDPSWGCDYQDGPLIRRMESEDNARMVWIWGPETGFDLGCIHDRPVDNPGYRDFIRQQGGLKILMQVLSQHATGSLIELSLGDITHACSGYGIFHWFSSPKTQVDVFPLFSPVFCCLRKLDLTFSNLAPTWVESRKETLNMVNLLASAKGLQELKLVRTDMPAIEHQSLQSVRSNCAKTLGVNTWQNLRVIFLSGFADSQSFLEDFLQRHSSSLRSFVLNNFCLDAGTWQGFASNVPLIAPETQIIFGTVIEDKEWFPIDSLLPLSGDDGILFASMGAHYQKDERYRDGEGEDESEEVAEESDSDYLEYRYVSN